MFRSVRCHSMWHKMLNTHTQINLYIYIYINTCVYVRLSLSLSLAILKSLMIVQAESTVYSRYELTSVRNMYFTSNWLVVSNSLKNMSQWGWLFPIYGIKVPNHQPSKLNLSIRSYLFAWLYSFQGDQTLPKTRSLLADRSQRHPPSGQVHGGHGDWTCHEAQNSWWINGYEELAVKICQKSTTIMHVSWMAIVKNAELVLNRWLRWNSESNHWKQKEFWPSTLGAETRCRNKTKYSFASQSSMYSLGIFKPTTSDNTIG